MTESMSRFKAVRWMIIVNPAAANGKVGRIWPTLERQIAACLQDYTVCFTAYSGHGVILAMDAVNAGFRHLIGVGGDGTNHEVTNGILQQKVVPSPEIFYTLLPVGTGNDWIRTHRIPRTMEAWLQMLEEGYCIQQEVGLVSYSNDGERSERYFVNVAGMAYDAFVVLSGTKWRSWISNRFFYLLLMLRCLFRYRLSEAVIETDGRTIRQLFYTINVGICRYSGGGMQLVPQADPTDGQLALTFVGPVSKLGVIFNTWRFYNGSIGRHSKIETTQARKVRVKAPPSAPPVLLEADGEFLGSGPAEFSLIPRALTIIVPRLKN